MGPVYVEVCECTRDLLLAHGCVSTAIFFKAKVRVKQLNAAGRGKKVVFFQVCSVARILLFLPFVFGACPGGTSENFN
jgi:hypothetical protein